MWKLISILLLLAAGCSAGPLSQQRKNMPIMAREDTATAVQQESDMQMEAAEEMPASSSAGVEAAPLVGTLTLPSNATSIRADITDNFSCANKSYGYYADVENDCQIFHVCLPVTYADGKENTFRWSFICPEETIFSQESFTCMRREDMTIECEESYRYYELNSNFGLPTEEEKQPAAATAAAAAVESEQAEPERPQPEESEMNASAVTAAAAPEPVMEPVKPVKVQKPKPKPNRRKPAITYNKPQRKVPVVVTEAPIIQAVEAEEPEVLAVSVVQQAAKPLKPHRFTVRPSNKEKPQPVKPAAPAVATPIRNELFNSIRKRPAMFNKNSISSTARPVQESEPAVTEAIVQAELSEPQPTLKLQTMFVEAAPAAPVAEQVAEPVAQASEPVVAIAEPEPEPEQMAEQIKSEEPAEQASPINIKEDEVQPIEAIPEIPAVIVETLEEKPQEIELIETNKPAAEQEPQMEDTHSEPAIVEPNLSNEETANIEAMEAAKPADAPVSLPATPAMEHPSPLVEQMLDNKNEAQASIGGFKPVDPVMAAEAEQLITDFLNTLRKHEEQTKTTTKTETETETELANAQTETDATAVSVEEAKLPEPEIVDKNASVEEQLLEAEPAEPQLKLKQDSPIINIMQLNHLPADYQIPVQPAKELETEALAEPAEPAAQDDAQESLPAAAYMPGISIDDIVELVKERLDQSPKNEQMAPMELVLTPGAAEPMTLIESKPEAEQQAVAAEPVAEIVAESAPVAELAAEPAPVAAEEQEVILPIYKRVSDADPAMSVAQTQPLTVSKVEAEPTPQQEEAAAVVPEVREPKTPSRMDARKRRFLFRADAS
ncbi:titin [Drosophila hydei]|uniref:Titin n=1 Tax=Drosophila hydei TaxID=7224 RepID=A0A6J2SYC2_DROHY|nr:titin [Drosophila hydei]